MFRIGEFSILSSISIHMLRNYDKIGLLVPEYVDEYTGYRYYKREQLVKANQIVALKSMGFGLKEIEAIQWNNLNKEKLEELFHAKLESKQNEMAIIQTQMRRMEEALVNHEKDEYAMSIAVKTIRSHDVVSLRDRIHEFQEEGRLWERIGTECAKHKVKISPMNQAVAIQHELNYEDHYIDVEVQFTVEKIMEDTDALRFYKVPEQEVASLVYMGQYSRIGEINLSVAKWIEQNGYQLDGKVFSIYHNSPENESDENKYITEICFPISTRSEV